MTTRDEDQALRDFVHTVDVLTASALAERELATPARGASVGAFGRRPFAAIASAACTALAVCAGVYGGLEYMRWQPSASGRIEIAQAAPPPTSTPTGPVADLAEERARLEAE